MTRRERVQRWLEKPLPTVVQLAPGVVICIVLLGLGFGFLDTSGGAFAWFERVATVLLIVVLGGIYVGVIRLLPPPMLPSQRRRLLEYQRSLTGRAREDESHACDSHPDTRAGREVDGDERDGSDES
jgi:hypothetical protein